MALWLGSKSLIGKTGLRERERKREREKKRKEKKRRKEAWRSMEKDLEKKIVIVDSRACVEKAKRNNAVGKIT